MRNEDVVNQTIAVQSAAITNLANDETINQIKKAAQLISETDGLIIFSGIGKSGIIANKLVSMFNSICISSHFLHPVDAVHGDLGIVSGNDVVVMISNSGNTEEMVHLLQKLRYVDPTTITITSNSSSKLGRRSDHHIETKIIEEGAIIEFIPMASATTTMVVGDCLANILMNQNGISENDFAQYHPGGTIGKSLGLELRDIINEVIEPAVPEQSLLEAILQISEGQKGIVAVVDNNQHVIGVLSDGDLRRVISRGIDAKQTRVDEVMTPNPVTMLQNVTAIEALKTIEKQNVGQIVVTNRENKYRGIIHMRDLVREGIT